MRGRALPAPVREARYKRVWASFTRRSIDDAISSRRSARRRRSLAFCFRPATSPTADAADAGADDGVSASSGAGPAERGFLARGAPSFGVWILSCTFFRCLAYHASWVNFFGGSQSLQVNMPGSPSFFAAVFDRSISAAVSNVLLGVSSTTIRGSSAPAAWPLGSGFDPSQSSECSLYSLLLRKLRPQSLGHGRVITSPVFLSRTSGSTSLCLSRCTESASVSD